MQLKLSGFFISVAMLLCSYKVVSADTSDTVVIAESPIPQSQSFKKIYAVVSDSNTPPYAIFDQSGTLSAGLSKDILDELATLLDYDIEYLDLPRTRIEGWLATGQADIACFLNPNWVSEPELYLWSPALFVTQQLFIRRADSTPITALPDLAGKRVGTTRGFTYPELEQVFALGDVVRDDAETLERNLMRLEQGRLDVVMSVDLSYYFLMANGGRGSFAADPIWSDAPSVYCAISQFKPQLATTLFNGLKILIENHYIDQQVRRYKGEKNH